MTIKQPKDRSRFLLPDLGEGVQEAELIKWRVEPGEAVEEHQTLAEMETDKALVEVPSPWPGVISELHGKAGDIINVGSALVSYRTAGAEGAQKKRKPATAAAASSEPGPEAADVDAGTVVGTVEAALTIPDRFARRSSEAEPAATAGKVLATPAVRRVARELAIDINRVAGTGRGGRVTAGDVYALADRGTDVSPAPSRPPAAEPLVGGDGVAERIPFRGIRRKIAAALDHSVKTAVHFTVVDEADVTALGRARAEHAATLGRKIGFLPLVMTAVCRALRQHPTLNAIVDDANAEILIKSAINLGCAVDTEHGLMVPVIADADRLSLVELGDAVADLAGQCRDRTIPREKLVGGSFTISNVGAYGGMFATPIINYPEVAILAVGRAREQVLVKDGRFYAGHVLPLSLSCDHRVVDGAEGARYLATVMCLLEAPEVLLPASD